MLKVHSGCFCEGHGGGGCFKTNDQIAAAIAMNSRSGIAVSLLVVSGGALLLLVMLVLVG